MPERNVTMRETEPSTISIAHLFHTVGQYRRVILVSLFAVLLAYALVALAIYVASPAVMTTSLPFRLEFEGAERGEYPNGLKFSTAEIVGTAVLAQVFQKNDLERFTTFPEFKDTLFILESNRELERLEAEYQSRLSDPKLTPVDRDRITREYQERAASVRHTEYALVMTENSVIERMPNELRQKILKDVLSSWAVAADNVKGALKYRLPVLTTAIVQSQPVAGEEIIGLDILRSRVNRVLANIDELLEIPGSETVRVGPEKISLAELRVTLEDVRRFQIEPLIMRIYEEGLIDDPRLVRSYFDTQLAATQRELTEARGRVETLQASFGTYVGRPGSAPAAGGIVRDSGPQDIPGSGNTQVVPQLSDSFLDKVVRMVSDTRDVQYRQSLLDRVNEEALQRLAPAEKELQYYTEVVTQMRSGRPAADAARRGAQRSVTEQARARALQEVTRAVSQVTEVYQLVSRNLDPDTLLYTRTAPITTTSKRTVSLMRLLVIGVGIFLLAIPAIILACLIHARVREEEASPEYAPDLPHAVRKA